MSAQILRLRRTDISGQHLLVHISRTGSKALDLKLVGTEHEHLYHGHLKETNVKSLQANKYRGDLSEWKEILKHAFLHERPEGTDPESLQGLETVAAISRNILTVTFRKNVGGITQRLGSITLEQDDGKEEISAFDWVDTAVATSDDLRSQLETLQASVGQQQDQVAKLNRQLDELVKAKKEHEDELLSKFAALLNAKKLKIRDQQRLLAGARVDPGAAEAVSEARRSGGGRHAAESRRGKRKANEIPEADDVDVMEDYEEQEDEERRQGETPPLSDQDATDDEDGIDGAGINPASMDVDEPEELPPRRELPFVRKNSPARQAEPVVDDDGDETDDEL